MKLLTIDYNDNLYEDNYVLLLYRLFDVKIYISKQIYDNEKNIMRDSMQSDENVYTINIKTNTNE